MLKPPFPKIEASGVYWVPPRLHPFFHSFHKLGICMHELVPSFSIFISHIRISLKTSNHFQSSHRCLCAQEIVEWFWISRAIHWYAHTVVCWQSMIWLHSSCNAAQVDKLFSDFDFYVHMEIFLRNRRQILAGSQSSIVNDQRTMWLRFREKFWRKGWTDFLGFHGGVDWKGCSLRSDVSMLEK